MTEFKTFKQKVHIRFLIASASRKVDILKIMRYNHSEIIGIIRQTRGVCLFLRLIGEYSGDLVRLDR